MVVNKKLPVSKLKIIIFGLRVCQNEVFFIKPQRAQRTLRNKGLILSTLRSMRFLCELCG